MAALLSENSLQHNGTHRQTRVHPALRSWRDELSSRLVRFLAYLGGAAVLSTVASHLFQSPKVIGAITPVHPTEWIDVERPFPAFALSIPEAADAPANYAVRRHAGGGGRKDILALGEPRQRLALSAGRSLSRRVRDRWFRWAKNRNHRQCARTWAHSYNPAGRLAAQQIRPFDARVLHRL